MDKAEMRGSIRTKILSIVLVPTISLGTLIIIFGVILLYRFYCQSIHDELASTTNMMIDCLDLTVRGDYTYEDGMLLKGDLNITDSTMLYRVREESQIDTTIFWQDTRIITTVENQYGVSAVGTKASEEVVEEVLEKGKHYFSNHLDINGEKYVGYYMPLKNGNHNIVGMIFAGKKERSIYKSIGELVMWFLLFSVIAVIVAALCAKSFSKKLVLDINMINQFLRTISEGQMNESLDDRIVRRNDELGSIGLYADRMRSDLQKLIEMDALTSLYNRRSGNNMLQALSDTKEQFTMVMCDIDWFKKINDNYGHDAGDCVLVGVSDLIRKNVGDSGFACRWGGEEFLLVYNTDFEQAHKKVKELQKAIRDYKFDYGDSVIKVTMTFGIEESDLTGDYEQIVKRADEKLYVGKNNGRNQIVA